MMVLLQCVIQGINNINFIFPFSDALGRATVVIATATRATRAARPTAATATEEETDGTGAGIEGTE